MLLISCNRFCCVLCSCALSLSLWFLSSVVVFSFVVMLLLRVVVSWCLSLFLVVCRRVFVVSRPLLFAIVCCGFLFSVIVCCCEVSRCCFLVSVVGCCELLLFVVLVRCRFLFDAVCL